MLVFRCFSFLVNRSLCFSRFCFPPIHFALCRSQLMSERSISVLLFLPVCLMWLSISVFLLCFVFYRWNTLSNNNDGEFSGACSNQSNEKEEQRLGDVYSTEKFFCLILLPFVLFCFVRQQSSLISWFCRSMTQTFTFQHRMPIAYSMPHSIADSLFVYTHRHTDTHTTFGRHR